MRRISKWIRFDRGNGLCLFLVLAMGLVPGGALAENIDPNNDGSQFAWGENTGWMNAEPGGNGGPGVFVENDGLTGYLWSENTGWVSLSCLNTGSCGTSDFGVTNDGNGTLAGYAWSENAGWISFSCTNDADNCATKNYGVTIDPNTGEFSGFAWGENVGWISFRSTGAVAFGVTTELTVLTPAQATQNAVDELDGIVQSNPGTPTADAAQDVINQLQEALNEFAMTPPNNVAAADKIEAAVGHLEAFVTAGHIDATQGTELMDQLAGLARQLAAEAIDQAIAAPGDPFVIAEAQQKLAEGDALRTAGAFKDSVNKYKDALAKAEDALP